MIQGVSVFSPYAGGSDAPAVDDNAVTEEGDTFDYCGGHSTHTGKFVRSPPVFATFCLTGTIALRLRTSSSAERCTTNTYTYRHTTTPAVPCCPVHPIRQATTITTCHRVASCDSLTLTSQG